MKITVLVGLGWGCSDHGIKIHEDPPTASLLSPGENTPFFEGQSVAFEVQLDDNDDGVDSLSIGWHSDATGTLRGEASLSETGIQTFVTTELDQGVHVVTVTATDPDGNKATDDVSISIRPNSAPQIGLEAVYSPDCSAYGVGEDAIIKAVVNDTEEDPEALILSWELNDMPRTDAPNHTDATAEASWVIPGLELGEYTVTARVVDSFGETEVASASFSVVAEDGDGDGLTTGQLGGEDCDDDDPDVGSAEAGHPDADGDGYGDDSSTIWTCDFDELSDVGGDCNDLDASVNPAAEEVCGDGLDNDCDGTSGPCKWTDDNLITSANHTSFGIGVSDAIASSLAGGDVNGDGYEDLIIGAAEYDDGGSNTGGVFIVPGPLEETVGAVDEHATSFVLGVHDGGLAGSAISTSDINDDGSLDLIIGAPGTSVSGVGGYTGQVYIFSDGIGETTVESADTIISGATAGEMLGGTVTSGGDLDGDGLEDFLITSTEDSTYATDAGAVSVFLGGDGPWEGLISIDDRSSQIAANENQNRFGAALEIVGDVNGDGRDDLLVGSPGAKAHGINTGAAYLFLGHASNFTTGSSRLQTSANATYTGSAIRNLAGTAVTGLGDVDGDGYTEFAISAPKNSDVQSSSGAVYLMLDPDRTGVHDLTDHADVVLYGALSSNRIGESLVGNIDLDNDGVSDLVVGAPQTDIMGTSSHGKAFFIYGPLTDIDDGELGEEDGIEDGAFVGEAILDQAGQVTLGGHDWTGDGVADLAITAPGTSSLSGVSDAGGVFVFFGRGM